MDRPFRCTLETILACAALCVLSACGAAAPAPATTTAALVPTITPTPRPLLPPDKVWAVNDGLTTTVMIFTSGGDVSAVLLPLNGEQKGSDVIASADGSTIAYLVWNDKTEQHGIAAWRLAEPNARLIYQPLSGYRIIGLVLSPDASRLAFVEKQQGKPLADADWRLQLISPGGGSPTLLANMQSQPDLLPPTLLGFAPDGTLYVNADTRYDVSSGKVLQGIFAVSPDGVLSLASPPADRVIGNGAVSPDGTRIAYTIVPGSLPGQTGTSSASVGRIANLRTLAVTTLAPPGGMSVASLRWVADGSLLLDMPAADGKTQTFALANGEDAASWARTSADATRARLFTYAPLGNGVIYSVFPAASDGQWVVYVVSDIAADSPPQAIPLGTIDQNLGAPKIIYAP